MNMLLRGSFLGGGIGDNIAPTPTPAPEPEDPEEVQARLEQEERRQEKHRKKEAERESMRQKIRDKYGIRKKDDPFEDFEPSGRVGALNRKTPEQLAAEMAAEDDDSLSGQFHALVSQISEAVQRVFGKK